MRIHVEENGTVLLGPLLHSKELMMKPLQDKIRSELHGSGDCLALRKFLEGAWQ